MKDEIQAYLKRAQESLDASKKLFQQGYFEISASRSYYAAFYAASALLLKGGYRFSKHGGVIAGLHQHFIKPGLLPTQLGKDLRSLFDLRGTGDYHVTMDISKIEAEEALSKAQKFIQAVNKKFKGP